MLGIDIDSRLIDVAWRQSGSLEAPGAGEPVVCWRREDVAVSAGHHLAVYRSDRASSLIPLPLPHPTPLASLLALPQADEHPDGCYDVVSCFSVTKWVHLLHGDAGLVELFAKALRLLRPGGLFLLEPQPWESYRKGRRSSAKAAGTKLSLRPHGFAEMLTGRMGFVKCVEVTGGTGGATTGGTGGASKGGTWLGEGGAKTGAEAGASDAASASAESSVGASAAEPPTEEAAGSSAQSSGQRFLRRPLLLCVKAQKGEEECV